MVLGSGHKGKGETLEGKENLSEGTREREKEEGREVDKQASVGLDGQEWKEGGKGRAS